MKTIIGLSLSISLLAATPLAGAQSSDKTPELREETRCFPAKSIRNIYSRFDDLKASQRDTVDVFFQPQFIIQDEGALPDRLYLKHEAIETDLSMDEEGNLPGLAAKVKASHETAELCSQDKARAGAPVDEPGAGLSLGMNIRYINESGVYDMGEIEDGLKDGKSFYKKMVGGPMAILVPKMTHVVISYEDESLAPQIQAYKADAQIEGFEIEPFDGAHVIAVKDLKKLGATQLKISGGEHSLSPAPSIKTMKKFGIGDG